MARNENDGRAIVPYIPFKTFVGLIARLSTTVVPQRIDSSVLSNLAGTVRGQLLSALKFLRLVEADGVVTDKMRALVKAYGTDGWKEAVADVISEAYMDVISDLETETATMAQMYDRFRSSNVSGQMLDKSVRFYLAAMTEAGWVFSPHLRVRGAAKAGAGPTARRKTKTARQIQRVEKVIVDDIGVSDAHMVSPGSPMARFNIPIPDKPAATILVPKDVTEDDWMMIDAMMRAYVARRAKVPVIKTTIGEEA